jgi:hypothetical protein
MVQRYIALFLILVAAYVGWDRYETGDRPSYAASAGAQAIAQAHQNRTSNLQVAGEGIVIKILSDDNDGSRHQRFILRLSSGQTLLVAHNIDVAPRIPSLREGESVAFNGVYEWNPKGGVIHWTHHDPEGRHTPGWLKYNGKTYQ